MASPDESPATRYYSESEVAAHNVYNDAWVSLFGKVLDITPLIAEYLGTRDSILTVPLVRFAGQDITHWFDPKSSQVRTHVDPVSNLTMPYTPHGRFIHVPPNEPSSRWSTNIAVPWWQDEQYIVGNLTKKSRSLRVVNTLTHQTHVFEVCSEETIKDIQRRYVLFNEHAGSYTWKCLGRVLDLHKTLEENGIADESEEMASLGINEQQHLPSLQLYYNDDLSVA
ncbi:unnamed protein product (mitochondrion) [Plasmodiophora brassicae]|uniref:Cytochrome b5 domain-containing protein 1 n=1 Tax=Plasmodiophora brassicae TaxID=37360 RepID=A0A3P3Y638_PLABS|nr:unnamed protein product [Plasmodiophora brassicae]